MRRSQLCLFAGIMMAASMAAGQSNPNTDVGMKPYDSLHGGALDSVSLTSGNLYFHKPLYSAPQRGRVSLPISLQYNNKGFRMAVNCTSGVPPHSTCTYRWMFGGSGVAVVNDEAMAVGGKNVDTGQTNGASEIWTTVYSAVTADGASHQLGYTGSVYRAIDGSGILWDGSSPSGLDRSGMYVGALGASSLDPNGNTILANTPAYAWTDSMGRVIPWPPGAPANGGTSLSSCPQLNLPYQPVTYAYLWNVPGPTGTSQFTLCYTTIYIRSAFYGGTGYCWKGQTGGVFDACISVNMLQSVVLPDGTAWTFQYDAANPNDSTSVGFGDLLKIGFPTGGSITYTYETGTTYDGYYASDMITSQSRQVASRTVDAGDGTGPHQWTYTWGGISGGILVASSSDYEVENVVSDPSGNETVHHDTGFFGGPSLYETQTRYYQGSHTSGTLLKTVNTDYSYSSNPFDMGPQVVPPTAINVVPIRVTTSLANGLTSKVETDYDSNSFTFHDPMWNLPLNPQQPGQNFMYPGTLSTVLARREYDSGAGAPGNLLNQTLTTYLWQNNSNYLNANLLDLPASVIVQDGAGNKVAETDSTYDESQYLTASNISTQHQAAPNSVRGNLTTVSHWLNTSSNPVVTHTNWYDTGEVYQAIDALGNTTTHSYDPYYAGAYPTKTCNALSQCVSATYDFNSGLLTSFTDQNASSQASGNTPGDVHNTWNYSYNSMFRMATAIGPLDNSSNHPETDFFYPNATTVQRCKKQNSNGGSACSSNGWIVDYAYFDGLGRTKQTRLVDPEGDDFIDTTYDALGRVSTVSNPHRGSSLPTDGTTTTAYDALGRAIKMTKQDGSVATTQYDLTSSNSANGDCTITTDEAGKQRKSCVDGLGRLIEVDEPQASTGSLTTPYVTLYSYDVLGNLLQVNQKGDGSQAARVRSFTYDSLSRLLTAANPESGTISYSYDGNGNVLRKISPAPNQTGTATQTISYCYDALDRLTGKAYSAQTCSNGQLPAGTASATYMYDNGTPPPFGGQLQNYIGRLVEENSYDSSGTVRSQNLYNYDSLGRVFLMEQGCGGGDCTDPPSSYAVYTYDLAGEVSSLHTYEGSIYDITYNYTYDTAGRATGMTSSLSDAQHPGTLASGLTYYPTGAIQQMTYGNGLTGTNAYNQRLQPCRGNLNFSSTALQNCGDAIPAADVQDISYGFNFGSGDNGNVASMTAVGKQSFNRSYSYDSLNRLTGQSSPGDACTGLTWSYDAWGNRLTQSGTGGTCNTISTAALSNNQISGYAYDAAGNMTGDGLHTYTYDAENRIISVDGGVTARFVYDAQGRRVGKIINDGGQWKNYLYGTSGEVLSESTLDRTGYGWPAAYAYFDGQLVAEYENSTTNFVHHDHLGSTRLMTAAGPSTRIQTSGGAHWWKYYYTGVCPGTSGVVYTVSVWIKNQGTSSMKISGNIVDGPVIAPGTTQLVNITETGNGVSCIQLGIATVNVGDGMDVLAYAPAMSASGGSNMVPGANQNFSGWVAYQGASVTVTQGQTPMVIDSMDYLPYGEQIAGSWGSTHKFTGKERDSETNLDYFGARYYGNWLGRFMSADWAAKPEAVPYSDLDDPQSLNLYSYVRNIPTSKADADGHQTLGDQNFERDVKDLINGKITKEQFQARLEARAVGAIAGAVIVGAILLKTSPPVEAPPQTDKQSNPQQPGQQGTGNNGTQSNDGKGSTLQPGPNAGEGVPARGPQRDFTPEERDKINQQGEEQGCHSCGSKDPGTKSGNFVPDHQPPNALNPNNDPQTLYPHCIDCSRKQGGEVTQEKKKPTGSD